MVCSVITLQSGQMLMYINDIVRTWYGMLDCRNCMHSQKHFDSVVILGVRSFHSIFVRWTKVFFCSNFAIWCWNECNATQCMTVCVCVLKWIMSVCMEKENIYILWALNYIRNNIICMCGLCADTIQSFQRATLLPLLLVYECQSWHMTTSYAHTRLFSVPMH